MTKRKKGCLIFLVILLVAGAIIAWFQTPNRKLEISEDTTHYTEPLLADGRVDYLSVLNRKYSVGVTNENNALIPLLEVLDIVGASSPEYRDRLLRDLGMGAVLTKHKLVGYEKLLAELFPIDPADEEGSQKRENELHSVDAPWKTADHPQLAEVLRQQSPALESVVEASRRPRLFVPMIDMANSDEERLLAAVLLPVTFELRSAAENLALRAMSRLGDGNIPEAIEDIKSIRRLARLIDQSPILVDSLISIAISRIAANSESQLIQSADITREQLLACQEFLVESQQFRIKFLERIGNTERCFALDSMAFSSTYGFDSAGGAFLGALDRDPQISMMYRILANSADPNEAMREVNRFFDKTIKSYESPDHRQRLANYAELNDALDEMEKQFTQYNRLAGAFLSGPVARGRLLGQLSILLYAPGIFPVYNAETRNELSTDLMHLAISIQLYKRATGQYPESLAELQPDYIKEIPQDWFSDGLVTYRRTGTGFVVYSVGENKIDDGGLDSDEMPGNRRGDIRVRVGELDK